MKLICPDCGKQYESGKFCLECGAKLQEIAPALVCPSCGYKPKSGKFCPECGTKLTELVAAPDQKESEETVDRKFNEKDERFAKYYDKKGFPRTIPQEERAIAIEELKPFAEEGISEAQMLLGGIYLDDTSKDLIFKGFELLKIAEQSGNKQAYYFNGMGYYYGIESIFPQDHNEAEKRMIGLYKEYENGDAAQLLALLYAYSETKCDYKKAFEYASIAAEDDEEQGYAVLGALYLNGWGVEKNVELALENYKMAAALGDKTALSQIGYIYLGNEGYDADLEQAFYWCNEAAKKGSDVGMNNLAYCYQNGVGVERDVEKAAEWYKKAAEAGWVDSMLELASYYEEILIDFDKSKMWIQRAAELGNPEAINRLGVIYLDREGNYEEAVKCFEKAIELGVPNAYRNLALCYRDGSGVKKNLKKTNELLAKAAELGIEDADEINDEMATFEQNAKARNNGANVEEIANLEVLTNCSVEISDIKVDKDTSASGKLGFGIRFKMSANGMVGRKLNISAYCVNKYGNKECLSKPGTPGRRNPIECQYAEVCSPEYASTIWNEFKIFIPYSEVLNIQADFEETLVIIVWDQTNKKPEILGCEELPYRITCKTHMFRSNEWTFNLLRQDPFKKLVKVLKKE